MVPNEVTRRALLGAAGMAGAGAGAAAVLAGSAPSAAAAAVLPGDPFGVGVASGDVTSSAVVLWTRLTTAPTAPGLGMEGQGVLPVEWRLAETPEGLESAASAVRVGAAAARPEHAWSVHVDVRGLRPGQTYWYEFRVAGWASGPARTRTAPADGASSTANFAVISCQNLAKPGSGRFHLNGVRDIAARTDLDFVVHLGDYIYDFGRAGHIPPRQITTLDDYRQRYGQYKSDPNLRAMHAAHPVFAVPDDHEFFDNVYGGDPDMDEAKRAQFNLALRAYWENMPLRGGPPRLDPVTSTAHLQTHRRIRWGSCLELFLVDNRQYRTPTTTILGEEQLGWLSRGCTRRGRGGRPSAAACPWPGSRASQEPGTSGRATSPTGRSSPTSWRPASPTAHPGRSTRWSSAATCTGGWSPTCASARTRPPHWWPPSSSDRR